MQFDILTIFPEYFDVLKVSLLGKAISEGKLCVNIVDIRNYSQDKHKKNRRHSLWRWSGNGYDR